MSPRYQSFEMGLPSFRGAVRNIIVGSTVIYVLVLLMHPFAPSLQNLVLQLGVLQPERIIRQGWVWQFVTYAFMYLDPLNFLLSLMGIYFIGSAVEDQIGSSRFYGLFFGTTILAAIAGVALSLTGRIAQGGAIGCGAASDAILMVFYLYNRGSSLMMFPLPIQIPVKWVVVGIAGVETAYLLLTDFSLQFCVILLGFGAGYLWPTS